MSAPCKMAVFFHRAVVCARMHGFGCLGVGILSTHDGNSFPHSHVSFNLNMFELGDRQTHRTATFVLPTLQRVFSGWVRTLTDGQADMRHTRTVEIVSKRRIRWCQLSRHYADSVARKLAAINANTFDSPAFLPLVPQFKVKTDWLWPSQA